MIFDASATLIEGAKYVPAFIILEYKLLINSADFKLLPETTFFIFVNFLSLSPGLILSGE